METYSAVGSVAAAAAAAPNKPLLPLPIPSMLAAIARASNASSSSIIDEDAADGGKDAVGAGVCGVAPAEAGWAKGALDPIPSMLAAIARANSASSSAYPPPAAAAVVSRWMACGPRQVLWPAVTRGSAVWAAALCTAAVC